MNWKEFLKLDWRKILLAIIIFLILPFPVYDVPICEVGGKCPSGYWIIVPFAASILITDFPEYNIPIYIILLLLILLISYLISCLIIYAYNKMKKKK